MLALHKAQRSKWIGFSLKAFGDFLPYVDLLACLLALLVYLIMMVHQFSRNYSDDVESSGSSSGSKCIQTFLTFVDEKEVDVKNRSKRRRMEKASNRSVGEYESTNGSKKRFSESCSSKNLDKGEEA